MSAAGNVQSFLGEYLTLFATTEVFIFVFMEIVSKLDPIQRVIFKKPELSDYIIFILVFGGFSIFGTLIGIPVTSGAISNIRDFSPIIAGLVAGPAVGMAVGLIGGIHRFSLGGLTCLPCSLATVLAGLIAGCIYLLNNKKLLGIVPAILFAASVELLHGALTLALAQPYSAALEVVLTAIPDMMIANSLGVGIGVIVIHHTKEAIKPVIQESSADQINYLSTRFKNIGILGQRGKRE
jgi:sigma-B regulation protein RsbU (phosphoserine phosphatase)